MSNQEEALTKLTDLSLTETELTTTPITAAGLYKGAYKVRDTNAEINKIDNILTTVKLLPLSQEATKVFGRIRSYKKILSHFPGDLDLLIASIAISNNESLLTRNHKHFVNISELKIETW